VEGTIDQVDGLRGYDRLEIPVYETVREVSEY
jgi:hypothetical protein